MAYVNRELVISEMEQVKKEHSFLPQICIKAIDVAINAFKIVPTADVVEVKHGKWIDVYKGKYHNKLFVCSICGGKALYKFVTNELGNKRAIQDLTLGCPHCLARMEGD